MTQSSKLGFNAFLEQQNVTLENIDRNSLLCYLQQWEKLSKEEKMNYVTQVQSTVPATEKTQKIDHDIVKILGALVAILQNKGTKPTAEQLLKHYFQLDESELLALAQFAMEPENKFRLQRTRDMYDEWQKNNPKTK